MSFDATPKLPSFPERAVDLEPGFDRFQTLITPKDLKEQYLFGIPLKSLLDPSAGEMSNKALKAFIARAVSEAEHRLRINISPVKYQDRYDYDLWDYQKYNFIQLNHWPVLQVESVKAKYPNAVDFIQYPAEWISIYGEFGLLQLTPTQGQLTQFFLTNDATYIPLLLGSRLKWPQLWQVTYVSGFEKDRIPAVVNDYIAHLASLRILEIVAPLLFPYASYGIGIDGVSQSIGTGGPVWMAQRIESLKQKSEELFDTIKRYYNHSLIMTVL